MQVRGAVLAGSVALVALVTFAAGAGFVMLSAGQPSTSTTTETVTSTASGRAVTTTEVTTVTSNATVSTITEEVVVSSIITGESCISITATRTTTTYLVPANQTADALDVITTTTTTLSSASTVYQNSTVNGPCV